MAYIHTMGRNADGGLNILIHFLTPTTSNSVGTPWKTAGLRMGLLGNDPSPHGDPAEAEAITAGDIVEIKVAVPLDPTLGTQAAMSAQLTLLANAAKASWLATTARDLDHYGHSQGTVT